ncbi:hypothetical protein [Riemerella anatipestifer]|nr:hypothetical protein [Riemerella anatipestifer]MDR7731532.1 hypothetical protein [Riemerella anatipestifer]MDR7767861.1 hypothetical protein [Riemerella anatipestifer]MDY3392754.1 hypothetical protein [Riemerella anatipestifer]
MNNLLKYFYTLFLLFTLFCNKTQKKGFDSEEKSIKSVLQKFKMIDENIEKIKEVNLDSISISLYKNPQKEVYDEIIVFRKKDRFYSIPFFSNMYFDYWDFKNEEQSQLYPKTNSTFEAQIKEVVSELDLNSTEFNLIIEELMKSVLNTETNLDLKAGIFKNYVYSTVKVDRYKSEDIDTCTKRTEEIYQYILNETNKTIRYNQFYLDSQNGRVYELINKGELKFRIKIYRIDCFTYHLNF